MCYCPLDIDQEHIHWGHLAWTNQNAGTCKLEFNLKSFQQCSLFDYWRKLKSSTKKKEVEYKTCSGPNKNFELRSKVPLVNEINWINEKLAWLNSIIAFKILSKRTNKTYKSQSLIHLFLISSTVKQHKTAQHKLTKSL